MKRGAAFAAALMALLLAWTGASAGVTGLDGALSELLDLNDDVRYSFSIQADSLMPYGAETLEMMNAVLGHVTVAAAHTGSGEGAQDTLSLYVDGESLMDMTERRTAQGTALTTSLLPNRTLVSAGSAMEIVTGGGAAQEPAFDALAAIEEAEGCYRQLTDAILPYAEQKKANYKITDIATSRWSRIARLTTEQSAELAPLIAQVLGCGMDAAFRAELEKMTYSKGFIVGLYQSEENGRDLAVYIKGNVTMGDGTTRKLSYQWAFIDEEGERRDTYKFELTGGKGEAENRTISASYARREEDGAFVMDGSSSAAVKRGSTTVTTTVEHSLTAAGSEAARTLEGTAETAVKTAVSGESETVTTTITPALTLTSAEGSGVLSGTVALQETTGKNVTRALSFRFDDEPAPADAAAGGEPYAVAESGQPAYDPLPESSLSQNAEDGLSDYLVGQPPIGYQTYEAPDTMQTFDLDTASEEQLSALWGEMTQNLAGRMIVAVAALPEQDAALLRDNLSDEDYAALLALLEQ